MTNGNRHDDDELGLLYTKIPVQTIGGDVMVSLKEFREERFNHYKASSVADALGVSGPTYRDLERNQEQRITPAIAKKLGKYFGCNGDIFLRTKPN